MKRSSVAARDIRKGQCLYVPGAELHDDLAGLVVVLVADDIGRADGRTRIYDRRSESWTTFRDDEQVRLS